MRGAYFEGMVHEHALLSSGESSEVVQLYFVLRVRYQADFDRPETPARRHGECARGQARVAARARAGRRGAPRARFARGAGAAARAVFVGVAGSHGRTVKRNRIMIGHVYAIYIAAIRSIVFPLSVSPHTGGAGGAQRGCGRSRIPETPSDHCTVPHVSLSHGLSSGGVCKTKSTNRALIGLKKENSKISRCVTGL